MLRNLKLQSASLLRFDAKQDKFAAVESEQVVAVVVSLGAGAGVAMALAASVAAEVFRSIVRRGALAGKCL